MFLDYKREALIDKLQGLTDEQGRMNPTASSLSLLSLIKHSTIWERRWFQIIVAGHTSPSEWPEVRSEVANKNLRFVALHLIEETAQHAGHADIICETIDASRWP